MKKYFLIILLLQAFSLSASVPFKKGDVLNVWATHGLPLYNQPDSSSKKLMMIPYGVPVIIDDAGISAKPYSISFKSDDIKQTFVLKGEWLKIKCNNQTGYVFSGYLSKMPCFKKIVHGSESEFESEDVYLKRVYGEPKVVVKKTVVKTQPQVTTTKTYKNGIIQTEASYDSCFDVNLYLNHISYQEGLLFEQVSLFEPDAANDIKIKELKSGKIEISYYACD